MMLQTPDLCGNFKLNDNGDLIEWDLFENIRVTIGANQGECYIGFSKFHFGKFEGEITHWHPEDYEIYDEVCKLGKPGNVTVLRSSFKSGAFLYSGAKSNCRYSPDKKVLFGKYYYLEAK